MDGRSTESGVSAVVEYDYAAKEPDELDLVKGDIIHSIKQLPGGWWEGTLKSTAKTGMFPDNFVRVIDMSEDSSNVVLRDKAAAANRRCKVIYSYTQVNDDELSLGVGDVIEFLGEVEEGWWRGRLRSKVGVFPSNFVVAIEPSPVLASKRPPTSAPNALAAAAHAGTTRTQLNATNATATSVTSSMSAAKKANRLSFHSSKEDLLSSGSATSTSSSSAHQHQQQQQTHHSTTTATATTALTTADDAAPTLPPKPQRAYCRVEFPYAPQNDDELELKVGDIISVVDMELPDKGWWKGELRGKIGVFPDNFVKLITTASPLNDSLDATSQKGGHVKITTTSSSVASSSSSTNATHLTTASTTTLVNNHHLNHNSSSGSGGKVMIKKSGSSSSTQSSNAAKENFGSRDSLNDILSETGLQTGNVAAQRRSLENKKLDLSQAAEDRLALKKQLQQHLSKSTTTTSTSSETSKTIITAAQSSVTQATASSSATELRKSMESLDEKTKAAVPPVLTKKPSVPSKKSTPVTSVAGNLISGLKQKVKLGENKLTTTVSHDHADGVASSRMSPGGVPEAGPAGNVVMRRAATIAVAEDSEFDRIERSSMLTDMRAGRVKAPKRRPPSAAINVIGESNNNETLYVNGSNGGALDTSDPMSASDDNKMQSSDDNSTGEEHLAKPKPREWEKKKAPWMEELKASQVKKKTSPGTDASRLSTSASGGESGVAAERSSRLSGDDLKTPAAPVATSKVQSPSVGSSASLMAQSMSGSVVAGGAETAAAAATQPAKRYGLKSVTERHSSETSATITTSSSTTTTAAANSTAAAATEDVRTRPNSLAIRNSRVSAQPQSGPKASESAALNNHHLENNGTQAPAPMKATPSTRTLCAAPAAAADENGVGRVAELERRIEKLESTVQTQQRTIDELVRTLREETDRVRVLRGELDKYAQCVTQV